MIITRVVIGSLTDLVVDEATYQTATGFSADTISIYTYDGADWTDADTSTTVDFTTLGITFDGTATTGDEILVAFHPSEMQLFSAGDGVNCIKLNTNFDQLKTQINTNEISINDIESTALLADGSNLSQSVINEFQQEVPNLLISSGSIPLTDNSANFLTITGDSAIVLPTVASDIYSHTITLVVEGSPYTLDLGTTNSILTKDDLDTTQPYSVLYMYHKVRNAWYYYISQ